MRVLWKNVAGLTNVTCIRQLVRYKGYGPLIPPNYPIKWLKPYKKKFWAPEKTGDLGLQVDVSPNDYILNCENSAELADADDLVKRMFTVNFFPRQEMIKLKTAKLVRRIQRHKYDEDSPEVIIAKLTVKINHLQSIRDAFVSKKNMVEKRALKHAIDKRTCLIKELREIDYKLYEWVLEKLNLVYRLPLEDPHEKVTRKGTIRMLTDRMCQDIIQGKLDEYRAQLDEEKKQFYKQKLDQLTHIKEQEAALGLNPTVSEEEIVATKEQAAKYC